ncbi:asparagine transport system permease protein [Brucella melitensis bv. 1 str. 16M]|uniref:Asparagine transport system permease protein n=3 Tax=Brucella melitensis TaxID=29459 RepID=Q8YJH0_BRUME|nr:asparagine transport system permease protein [Brucella melitensis bv. 1 str. 16M]EEZ15340.1 polar amino acid ABC transporter [Brucella melitensis bv. 1 str. Rev.1]
MPQRFAGFRNGPHDKSSNDHIEGNDDGLQRLRPGRCLSPASASHRHQSCHFHYRHDPGADRRHRPDDPAHARHSPLNAVIGVVISFIRGTPILVQIFLFYYGLPALGLDLSPIQAGILAIAFNSSIFITEIMRGGLSGMDSGPVEAAIALGIKGKVIWTKVILPQLYIRIMPPLVNELTTTVKGTALLSVITVVEVLRTAQQVANASFRPLETLLCAAIILFAVNLVLSQCGRVLEMRFAARRG